MTEYKSVLERASANAPAPDMELERILHRHDRKRRNQRITAGVVGIAVFMAAIWIVTSRLSLVRSEKSVAPAGEVTGPAETGPAETAPPHGPPSGRPDLGTCNGTARPRLAHTRVEGLVKVQFEVYRSPVGHEWHIRLSRHKRFLDPPPWPKSRVLFQGTRVASDSGALAVQVLIPDNPGPDRGYVAKAVDQQTGQACRASAWF